MKLCLTRALSTYFRTCPALKISGGLGGYPPAPLEATPEHSDGHRARVEAMLVLIGNFFPGPEILQMLSDWDVMVTCQAGWAGLLKANPHSSRETAPSAAVAPRAALVPRRQAAGENPHAPLR